MLAVPGSVDPASAPLEEEELFLSDDSDDGSEDGSEDELPPGWTAAARAAEEGAPAPAEADGGGHTPAQPCREPSPSPVAAQQAPERYIGAVVARRFLNADYAHEVSFARVTATRMSLYEGQVWRVVYDDEDREELIWAELSAALELKASLSRTTPASPRTRSRSQSSAEAPSQPGEEVEVEPAQLRYKGVYASGKRFRSQLYFGGRLHSCGYYDTAEDAARARAAKLRSLELQMRSGKRARGSISEDDEDVADRSTRKRLSAAPPAPVVQPPPIRFRGVYATGSRFHSSFTFKGKCVYCGTHDTTLAAARARDARILELGAPTDLMNFKPPAGFSPAAAPSAERAAAADADTFPPWQTSRRTFEGEIAPLPSSSTRMQPSAAPPAPVVQPPPICFRGVYANGSKFMSSVCFEGRQVFCGSYDTALAAAHARDARIRVLGLPTHLLNFPDVQAPSAAPADDGSDSDGGADQRGAAPAPTAGPSALQRSGSAGSQLVAATAMDVDTAEHAAELAPFAAFVHVLRAAGRRMTIVEFVDAVSALRPKATSQISITFYDTGRPRNSPRIYYTNQVRRSAYHHCILSELSQLPHGGYVELYEPGLALGTPHDIMRAALKAAGPEGLTMNQLAKRVRKALPIPNFEGYCADRVGGLLQRLDRFFSVRGQQVTLTDLGWDEGTRMPVEYLPCGRYCASAGGAPEQQQLSQRAAPFVADAATQTELRDVDAAWLRAALLALQDSDSL